MVAALATLTLSCKKDEDKPAPAASKADLLTAKNWKVSAQTTATTTSGTTTTTDDFAMARACEKDNFLKFQTDKTVRADEGATKCNTADPQTQNGVWDFNSDQTKLTLGIAGSAIVGQFDLVELTATTLRLRVTNTAGGITEVETTTYTAF